MDLIQKLIKFRKVIKSNKRHCDYARTVKLAKEYKAHITGVDIDAFLMQFVQREDATMFEQRKRLTESISPSVADSLIKPFFKVARNKNIKTKIALDNLTREENVYKMMSGFYGSNDLNSKGLDYWIRTRFIELTFIDPNAFVFIEWIRKSETEVFEPYPFEVKAENVLNYKYVRGILTEILVKDNELMYFIDKNDIEQERYVDSFTSYEIGNSFKIVEYCPKYYAQNGIVINESNQIVYEDNGRHYIATYNETKLSFIPAFRVGYKRDNATDGRTCVNPFESAMPYFRKSLKAVSELDLSITLHTFPQKLQYVQRCTGESRTKRCNEGTLADGSTCSKCKGSGILVATSGQDAILLPLPDKTNYKDELIDLDKLVVYKTPPIELIKFQETYVDGLKMNAHLAVYNTNQLISTNPQIAKTATEIDINSEGIYDALFPYTEKYSEVWKTIVTIFVKLTGFDKDFELVHNFPADLKLKSTAVLLAELKAANESQAPSYFRDAILEEIANQIYEGDELGRLKHFVRHKFFPFPGKSEKEIQFLLSSEYVSNFTKVLYSNFEAIFTDIEKIAPEFYSLNYVRQWELVTEATEVYIKDIKESQQSEPFKFDFTGAGAGQTDEEKNDLAEDTEEVPL